MVLTKDVWKSPLLILDAWCLILSCSHWQVVPELFQCTTYPLTALIEHLWNKHEPMLKEGYVVDPFDLETVAMLERVLNYAHTGSARVLTRALMDRAWLSLSVVNDGLPCISPSFIQPGALTSGLIHVRRDKWPVHPVTLIPVTVLFPHRSILLFFHTRCLLTWRGRRIYTNTAYLFLRTASSFCFFDLSMDLANS